MFIAILGRFTVMKQKLGRSTVIGQKLGNLTVMRQKLGCFTVMKHILSWFLPTNFKQNVLIHDTYLKSNVMISDNYLKLIKRHTKFCEIGNPNFIKPKWSHIVSLYIVAVIPVVFFDAVHVMLLDVWMLVPEIRIIIRTFLEFFGALLSDAIRFICDALHGIHVVRRRGNLFERFKQALFDGGRYVVMRNRLNLYVYIIITFIIYNIIGPLIRYTFRLMKFMLHYYFNRNDHFIPQGKKYKQKQEIEDLQNIFENKPEKKSKKQLKQEMWEAQHANKISKSKQKKEKIISEFGDWSKEAVINYKPKPIVAGTKFKTHNLTGPVFENRIYVNLAGANISLSKFLRWLQWDQIPQVIGSCLKYNPNKTTAQDHVEYNEFMRNVRQVSKTWHLEEGIIPLKEILVKIFDKDPTPIVNASKGFVKNNKIYIDVPSVNKDDLFIDSCGLLDFLRDGTKSNQWNEPKIRTTIKNMKFQGHTDEEVLAFFDKKFYIPNANQVWNKEQDLKRLSWSIPYLPPEIYQLNISSDNQRKFFQIIRQSFISLKDRAVKFIKVLLAYRNLSYAEKKEAKRVRIEKFKERMRSPDIQQLFLTGRPKNLICDQIHRETVMEQEDELLKQFYRSEKEVLKRITKINKRREARDLKYADVFEHQSSMLDGVYLAETTASWFSVIFGFLSLPVTFLSIKLGFAQAKKAIVDEINEISARWKNFATAPFAWASHSKNKLLLIQVNSILQIIYLIFKKQYQFIAGHAINLGISNWNIIVNFFMNNPALFDPERTYDYVVYDNGLEIPRHGTLSDYQQDHLDISRGMPLRTQMTTQSGLNESIGNFAKNLGMNDWGAKSISEMNQKFLFVKNVTNIGKSSLEFLKAIISIVGRTFFGFDPFSPEYMDFVKEVEQCLYRMEDILHYTEKTKIQSDSVSRIWYLNNRVNSIRRNMLFQSLPNYKINYFNLLEKRFNVIYEEVKNRFGMRTERYEPVSVMIIGKAGSGKSASVKFFERALVHMYFKAGKHTSNNIEPEDVYTLNLNDRFYSGYANQMFVEIDDIFKSNDQADRSREAQEVINMINTAAYPLNMAGLTQKGTMFFDSEFVFMTTNIVTNSIVKSKLALGLTDNEAFVRRLHLVLVRNEPINKDDFIGTQTFTIDQCIMYPHLVGKVYNLRELSELIYCMKLQTHKQLSRRNMTFLDMEKIFTQDKYLQASPEDSELLRRIRNLTQPDVYINPLIPENVQRDVALNLNDRAPDDFENHALSDVNEEEEAIDFGVERLIDPALLEVIQKDIQRGIVPWYEDIKWRNVFLYVFVAIASATTLLFLYKWLVKTDEKDEDDLSVFFSTESSYKKKQKSGAPERKFIRSDAYQARDIKSYMNLQSDKDGPVVSNYDKSIPNIMLGTGFIAAEWYEDGKPYHTGAQCSHMENGWFLTCTHFFLDCGKGSRFYMTFGEHQYHFDSFEHVREAAHLDITIFKLKDNIQLPKALFKYLPKTIHDTPITEGTPMRLLTTSMHGEHSFKPLIKFGQKEDVIYEIKQKWFMFVSPVIYLTKTHSGNSGSIITIEGKQNRPLLVGMHTGIRHRDGNAVGMATPLTQEIIKFLMSDNIEFAKEDIDDFENHSNKCDFPLEIKYKVSPEKAYVKPRRHNIKKSLLHGWRGPPTFIPAKMIPFENEEGEIIDPYINGVKKLHQTYTKVKCIAPGSKDYLLSEYPQQNNRELLTFDQIIKGTGEYFTSVNSGTSPGYPYCLKKTKGKGPWITVNEQTCDIEWTEELEMEFNDYETKLRRGEQIDVIWADVLKAETREIEKVNKGKTRLFATCPLHFLLLMRKYLGRLTEYMQSQCLTKPISVGINPHSLDWAFLYNRLAKTSGSIIAGDFSNYDGIIPRAVGEVVLDFVNDWYDDGETNAIVRKLLFEHIYNAHRINDDFVYEVKDGNPSGNPWTSWYNSLCQLVMWYTILTLEFKMDVSTWTIVVYGDDNVLSTVVKNLRVSDFKPFFKEYFGMEYTHFSKKEVDPYDTLDTIRYLGRKFVQTDYPWMAAPLDLQVIVESLYWTQSAQRDTLVLYSTLESFITELFHFGREFFIQFKKELLAWVEEHISDPIIVEGIRMKLSISYYTILNRNYNDFKPISKFEQHANKHIEIIFPNTNEQVSESMLRNIAEPNITENDELGGFRDVSEMSEHIVNSQQFQDPYKDFNLEAFTIDDALQRTYPIGTINWSSTQDRDELLATFNFPDILFSQPFIQKKIADFNYFIGSIELMFRVVANPTLYGMLMAAFMPYPTDNASVPNDTVKMLSGLPHVLLSADSSDVVKLKIPFICKDRVLNILNYEPGQMAQVYLMSVFPLTDALTANPSNAKVFVTARFVDAKVYLPITTESFSTKKREADNKSSKGIISSALDEMADIASVVKNVPFTAQYAAMFEQVARPAASMLSRIGLSKPTTTAMTEVGKINPYVDINQGEGLDLAPKLGFNPNNGISTIPNVGGQSVDEMELLYVAGTPMLDDIVAPGYTEEGHTYTIFEHSDLEDTLPYMDQVNRLFAYHSGSTKVGVYIVASKYHSVRLVFWINNTVNPAAKWEDCYHQIVDVQGSTKFFFTIPYLNHKFAEIEDDPSTPKLYMTVVSYNQPDSALDTPIGVLFYRSAGSDYKWGGYCDRFIVQSDPRADFSEVFQPMHPSMKGFDHHGLLYGEEYRSFRQVVHRYHQDCAPDTTTSLGQLYAYQTGGYIGETGQNVFTGIEMIGKFYLFHRGAIRLKLVPYGVFDTPGCLVAGSPDGFYSGMAISSVTNPAVEMEIPWYSNRVMASNNLNITAENIPWAISNMKSGQENTWYIMKSAGDDFSYHFLCPFKGKVLASYTEGVGNFGTQGLYNLMNAY